ncbi:hypothetical protein GCM10027185_61670 [Spirosoma pulveris]
MKNEALKQLVAELNLGNQLSIKVLRPMTDSYYRITQSEKMHIITQVGPSPLNVKATLRELSINPLFTSDISDT